MQPDGETASGNERWRVLALMTSAQAGVSVVQQALGSLSVVLVAAFALSKAQLGVVFTAILLGATCFTAVSGALTDRWGERKMVLVSALVMMAGLLGATLFVNYGWLVAMTALYGAGYAASTPAGGRAILAWFDRERGLAMGIRQAGVSVGGLVGALALPVVAQYGGYRASLLFAAVLVIVPSAIAFALYRESRAGRGAPIRFGSLARGMTVLARDPRLVAVTLTCMTLAASQFVMNAFLTITAVSVVHTSVAVAGLALALAFATAICGRLAWGYVSDRAFGGDRVVPLGIICILVGLGATILAVMKPGAVGALFFAAALLGFTASGWNGLMAAALSEIGGADRAASALGLGLTGIYAASAIAPWLFGLAADRSSVDRAWGGVALLAFTGTLPMLWLRARLAQDAPRSRPARP